MTIAIAPLTDGASSIATEVLSPRTLPVEIGSDGATLSGWLFLPKAEPRGVVVLHGAVGVPQRRYRSFAGWLAAERGLACLTYDYRDFGASRTGPLHRSKATLTDWGLWDQEAAMDAAEFYLPGVPLWVIGHSIGGAMLPYHRARRIERAIILGAGLLHVSDHPWPYRMLARQFWHLTGPLATWAAGYLPGKLTGFGSDLPAGVFWQWRRWCNSRGFHLTDAGSHLPHLNSGAHWAPTRVIAVGDDAMVPAVAVWRLMDLLPDAMKRQRVLWPEDFGLARIGHLGAFRRENAVLWPSIVD